MINIIYSTLNVNKFHKSPDHKQDIYRGFTKGPSIQQFCKLFKPKNLDTGFDYHNLHDFKGYSLNIYKLV